MYNLNFSKNEIFNLAIDIEQNYNKENIGSQDQVISTVGGFKTINFTKYKILISNIDKYKKNLSEIKNISILIY